MKPVTRMALGSGAVFIQLSIVFEAYRLHILQMKMQEDLLYAFEVGVKYQAYQGLGLILLGIASMALPYNESLLRRSALLIITGIILYSGSLYLAALTNTKILGLMAPLGGLTITAGWLIFTFEALKIKVKSNR